MKHLFLFSSIIVLSGMLSACATGPKPGSPEAAIKIAQEVKEEKEEAVDQIVSDIPDWCNNVPSSNTALYACGDGNSSNLSIARTRANLNAKRQLADQVDSEISAKSKIYSKSIGTGSNEQVQESLETSISNVSLATKLSGYKQVQSEVQNIGSKFQIYVLLEYPVGQANQTLINLIKENEILSTQEGANKALAELEAEINKKKGS
jgi:hypothetical protein